MANSKHNTVNQHITVLISFVWLIPLVSFIPPLIAQFISPIFWVNFFSLTVIVPLLSYVLMPLSLHFIEQKRAD